MKALERTLFSGWLALGVGVQAGRGSLTVNNIGNSVLVAARALAADGRSDAAKATIAQAKRPEDGELEATWNSILTQVESHL